MIRRLIKNNSFIILSILFSLFFYFNYFFGDYVLSGDDASSLYYPAIYYLKENLTNGQFPFYSDKLFAGYPIYQYSETGYLNPLRILLTILLPFEKVLPAEFFIFFFIGLLGYFKFLREKKISEPAIFFSHFIFFYNFQFTNRFVHQQMIFCVLLLPMVLYLTERFFSEETSPKQKKTSLILTSIVISLAVLYGNFPGVFILLFGQFVYLITEIFKKQNALLSIKYYLFLGLLSFSFSFFSLLPTYSLFTESARNIEEFSVTKGSISPILLTISFFTPFPLGDIDNYVGESFHNTWFWHEIHTYQGLTFLLLTIFGFIYLKNIKFKRFFIVSISLFIVLATLKFTPFGNIFDFPPFNLFRYHLRSGMIFFLALSFVGASVIHHLLHFYEKQEKLEMLKNFILLLVPAVFLSFVTWSSLSSYESKTLITHFINLLPFGYPYLKTSLLAVLFVGVLLIAYKFFHRKYLILCVIIISSLELVLFSSILVSSNLTQKDLINNEVARITNFYEGKRVVFDSKIYGNQVLYYKPWNIYGYSAYDQKTYVDFMKTKSLNVRRYKEKNYFLLEDLKVYRVLDENNNIHSVSNGEIFPLNYEVIDLNPNHKKFLINTNQSSQIETFIKFDKNIEILVNKKRVEYPELNGIFYKLNLEQGENSIEFIYQPRELLLGMVIGIMLSIFSLTALKIWNLRS